MNDREREGMGGSHSPAGRHPETKWRNCSDKSKGSAGNREHPENPEVKKLSKGLNHSPEP